VQRHSGDANTADVMKGASNARTIWQIEVTFSAGGTEVSSQQIDIDQSIAIDPDYQIIADKWRGKLLELVPFFASRIGYAATPLDGREASVRNGDSNWGSFIADQMRTAFRDPPADLAFVNGGTLRIDDFVADDITFEDIGRTFGFSSYLRHMAMSGGEFRKTLEAGYRGTGEGKGYFPQISGFRVCVDRNRPDGQRIVQMQVPTAASAWQEIEPEHMYSVVVPDFLYRGGDGYDFTAAADVSRPGSELKFLVLDAVIRAQAAGTKVGAPLDPSNPRFAIPAPGAQFCFD
jgi:5'-nucleotidase